MELGLPATKPRHGCSTGRELCSVPQGAVRVEDLEASSIDDGLQIVLSGIPEVHVVEIKALLEKSRTSRFFSNQRGCQFPAVLPKDDDRVVLKLSCTSQEKQPFELLVTRASRGHPFGKAMWPEPRPDQAQKCG